MSCCAAGYVKKTTENTIADVFVVIKTPRMTRGRVNSHTYVAREPTLRFWFAFVKRKENHNAMIPGQQSKCQ